MADPVKDLYARLGPVLYARAVRALNDQALAEELTKEVVIGLTSLTGLSDAELLKEGRERLQKLCAERGQPHIDSLLPNRD